MIPGPSNQKSIASRIIEIESRKPGSVRISIYYGVVSEAVRMLKEMGFKKPIFQNPKQFITDCALSYHQALNAILEFTLLSGPMVRNGECDCWFGHGEYAGWQGHFQLSDLSTLSKNKVFFVINISHFIDEMSDLLAPIQNKG